MRKLIETTFVTLDGLVNAANVRPEEPMGDGGERLHEWAFSSDDRERKILAQGVKATGAVIAGVIETPAALHLRFRVIK